MLPSNANQVKERTGGLARKKREKKKVDGVERVLARMMGVYI